MKKNIIRKPGETDEKLRSRIRKEHESKEYYIDWSTLTEYNGKWYVCRIPKPKKIKIKVEVE